MDIKNDCQIDTIDVSVTSLFIQIFDVRQKFNLTINNSNY